MKKLITFILVFSSFQVMALSLKDLGRVNYDKADTQTQADLEDRVYNQIKEENSMNSLSPGQVRFENSHVYKTGMGESFGEANRDVKGNLN
jgi:hypothetical protein